jgi:BirA family biotin operon repressor/biotin-[acetyl-CoA-carboxylase] ligase
VDSTNNYAMGLVHAGMAQHGTSVFAHEQTKGRGQRNKQWLSETNSNIALSIIFEPQEWSTSQLFILSKLVSTGVLHFFNSYTTGGVAIKWPNDIYWCDRKAGGILIENIIQGSEWKYSVAGIGLNINQTDFKKLKNKAVSLRQITGSSFDPSSLAIELCIYLDANLFQLGKKVKLKKGSRLFEAVIKDVTSLGQLVVQHAVEERFEVGEVEWVI